MQNRQAHSLTWPLGWVGALTLSLLVAAGCSDNPSAPDTTGDETTTADARGGGPGGGGPGAQSTDQVYEFAPPVFDIAAAPNGNILVAETVFPVVAIGEGGTMTTVKEIRRTGRAGGIRDVAEITTVPGSAINGLEMIGAQNFFATTGGKDRAFGTGVYHVTPGGQRLIADIEAFETENDPDANEGPRWKTPACEFNPDAGFSAGPHSNPYHVARLGGGSALVADAAGNTLLEVNLNGQLDLVAVFTPPVADGSSSDDPADWMVLFPLSEDVDCYVQPVPTSVAVGSDGGYYVGELTGVTPADIGIGPSPTTGLSRVWRIEPGARNVTCPSADCQQVLGGFTSIIDVAFGPDGMLHVVEYDEANWFAATELGAPADGTINACDVDTGDCSVVEGGLTLPSAITFDKWGDLWLLENNLAVPTVHQVELD